MTQPSGPNDPPLKRAHRKTKKVRDELHVAGGELRLSNTILRRSWKETAAAKDVGKAIEQNDAVAEKIADAREELGEVDELLEHEASERERLEMELAKRQR